MDKRINQVERVPTKMIVWTLDIIFSQNVSSLVSVACRTKESLSFKGETRLVTRHGKNLPTALSNTRTPADANNELICFNCCSSSSSPYVNWRQPVKLLTHNLLITSMELWKFKELLLPPAGQIKLSKCKVFTFRYT